MAALIVNKYILFQKVPYVNVFFFNSSSTRIQNVPKREILWSNRGKEISSGSQESKLMEREERVRKVKK